MPSYEQLPGSLNLSFNRGDDFAALVDFSVAMTGYAVAATIHSLVDGSQIVAFSTSFVSQEQGKVNISLTDTQTAAIPKGTYTWNFRWVEVNATTRTALSGFVEVL